MDFKQIKKINSYEWEIARSAQPWMRVPVRIFSDESMLKAALQDRSLDQAVNAAALPGLVGRGVRYAGCAPRLWLPNWGCGGHRR